jgi:hypothetical protein
MPLLKGAAAGFAVVLVIWMLYLMFTPGTKNALPVPARPTTQAAPATSKEEPRSAPAAAPHPNRALCSNADEVAGLCKLQN